jgi:hypothetical protein
MAFCFQFITPEEAKLPDDVPRGVTPRPGINIVGPKETVSPFDFTVEFIPIKSEINMNSLQIRYLKHPQIDLKGRISEFLDSSQRVVVYKIIGAEVPPGKHRILFHVEDSNGQEQQSIYEFTVVPRQNP